MMKRADHNWLRLLQSTGQPKFLSKENSKIYLKREKERDEDRKKKYVKVKIDMLEFDPQNRDTEKYVGAAGG